MKALMKVAKGPGGVRIQEIAEPQPMPGEVKVKIHACGICGTDIHIFRDEYTQTIMPVIMGHEWSGVVTEVAPDVTEFQPGDRVVSTSAQEYCGRCRYCNEGLWMLCDNRRSLGSGVNGAFAPYLTLAATSVFKLPENVSLDEAALCEPFAVAVRGTIERSSVKAGDHVLVAGPGPIGLSVAQVAIASGGRTTVAGTSADRSRLKVAMELGAAATIVVDEEDVSEKASEITGGTGFDAAFECAGVPASTDMCLRLLRKHSVLTQMAVYEKTVDFDFNAALFKEITITPSFGSQRSSWAIALKLLANKQVNLMPLSSATFPLTDWEKAFRMVINKEGLKVLLDPNVV